MLTKRIIPCLDIKNSRAVKGTKFKNLKDAGDPVKLAKFYYEQGADELVLLDITATLESRKIMLNVVEAVSREIFIPFTVGGGIRNVKDIADTLRAGADKVAINTAAVNNPLLISQAAEMFGRQCVVIAVDAIKIQTACVCTRAGRPKRRNVKSISNDKCQKWEVMIEAGTRGTGLDVIEWVKEAEKLGAGEILLTSIDRDGTRAGYDLELLRAASNEVRIPVIASGGAGGQKHILEALTIGSADAALLAGMLHYDRITIRNIKRYLLKHKVKIRI